MGATINIIIQYLIKKMKWFIIIWRFYLMGATINIIIQYLIKKMKWFLKKLCLHFLLQRRSHLEFHHKKL